MTIWYEATYPNMFGLTLHLPPLPPFRSTQVMQGLRMLELCVDNLTAEFLDPILSEVQGQLMYALWQHLRPPPHLHGPHALRILGKLAGRNRRFLKTAVPPPVSLTTNSESGALTQIIAGGRGCIPNLGQRSGSPPFGDHPYGFFCIFAAFIFHFAACQECPAVFDRHGREGNSLSLFYCLHL